MKKKTARELGQPRKNASQVAIYLCANYMENRIRSNMICGYQDTCERKVALELHLETNLLPVSMRGHLLKQERKIERKKEVW